MIHLDVSETTFLLLLNLMFIFFCLGVGAFLADFLEKRHMPEWLERLFRFFGQ